MPRTAAAIPDHAFLSDCCTAALVTRDGVVDRWPAPRHQPTGGIVAAATTSLPEVGGRTANRDYRYVCLRDAAMTASALSAVPDALRQVR